jgi:hypothetical protein
METADDDVELTREDKLRLKALLKLLDKAASGTVAPPPAVVALPDPDRRAKIRAKVIKNLKRQGRL